MSTVRSPGDLVDSETVPGAGQGVVALYREPYGPVHSCGAAGLRGVALEEFGPVSEPVPYRGRKGIITYWPVATREQTVVCGSLRQWRLAVELDFEPGWAAFSAGPVELRWRAGGRLRRWRPDFLARTANGMREVLVLKPPGQESLPAVRLEVLEDVARAAGWRVRQVREPTGLRGRNLTWLAGYRFPEGDEDGQGQALLEAFGQPAGLGGSCSTSGSRCCPMPWPGRPEGPEGGPMAETGEGRFSGSLSIGARVRWQEREWEVVAWQGPQVTLVPQDDAEAPRAVSYRWLVGAEDFTVVSGGGALVVGGAALDKWGRQEGREEEAALWQARMVEIDTGLAPGRSEHERGFGPGTTLAQRCAAMSARLAADGIRCSAHTLADKRRKWKAAGENPVVLLPTARDKRPGGFTDPRCLTAMQEVVTRRAHESDVTIDLIREEVEDLLHSRYAKELGDPAAVAALLPSRSTFYLRMKEAALADALAEPTRARAALASTPPLPHGGREAVLRPGQVTQVDTTPLRILARGDDGRPTATEMTSLIDVANHSMCALMITPSRPRDTESGQAGQATRAIDLTLMLAQVFAPWPVMPGWDPLSAAAASTLPFGALRAADERFTEATAARPVIRPELIIYDQGSPYVSEHFTEVCDRLRIARRPARKKTAPDKSLVEHSFTTLAHRFSQYVRHGWQGRSHKKRGRGIERMPLYTIAELQQMAQEWVALEYQQTPDAGLRDPFRPGVVLSPNDMYAVQVARSGYRAIPLSPARNRLFLLSRWVVPGKGGFMINYRTYQPVAQDAAHYREILLRGGSKLPGREKQWECRFNPYRPERVWLYDHTADTWVTCDFRLRHLLHDPWTADMWQEHAEQHRAAGGSEQDEAAIALALAQRDRRRRSRRPPPKRTGSEQPFQGLELETDQPSRDPYAGLEEFDLSTLRPYPALPISPMAPPPASAPPALPAGTGGADRPSDSGQTPHPLAGLFPYDGDGRPQAPTAEVPAAAYEVVEAELLDDLDPDSDDEAEDDVWEM